MAKPPCVDRSGTLCLCMELLEALLWYLGVTLAANFDQLWAVLAAPPASRPDDKRTANLCLAQQQQALTAAPSALPGGGSPSSSSNQPAGC